MLQHSSFMICFNSEAIMIITLPRLSNGDLFRDQCTNTLKKYERIDKYFLFSNVWFSRR